MGFLAIYFLLIKLGTAVSAQIIPDSTLPNNSVTLPNENLTEIVGGTTAGSNLFHSFEQFSLPEENTAWFNNASTIDNIIGRVTGSSISTIDGLIRANDSANLFLINPNGIIFGENAALDMGGSFIGSTANSLKFADDNEFSAVDPQASALLTVNIPVGLQYGNNNGDIVVRGSGNQLQFNPDFTVNRDLRPTGIKVDEEKTLALVGGNIFLDGGNLTAESGRVELGSVADHELVRFDFTESGLKFDYSAVSNFKDINLVNATSLEVSGIGGGEVQVQGKEVIITDGSAILVDTIGNLDGGKLQVNASELLVVAGTALDLPFISRLSTDVAPGATGNGGDIELNSANLIITDGAQVISSSYGDGDTGNIKVNADYLELFSGSRILNSSGLFTLVFGTGKGGDIEINANDFIVSGGAQAATITFAGNDGGDLKVDANYVELAGTSRGGTPSGLLGIVEFGATGNGGSVTLDAESLSILAGGQIAITTFGDGDSGILNAEVQDIQLRGTSSNGNPSGLFSNIESSATGDGGQIQVKVNRLDIVDGAQVAATNFGLGKGGSLKIEANQIELLGGSDETPSGLFTAVTPQGTGDGGSLEITTGNLTAINGSQIAVSTAGIGKGGELVINANEIDLIGSSEFGASGIFGNAIIGNGDGGNLEVNARDLTILDGATISASNFSSSNRDIPPGEGKAGSVTINSAILKLDTTSVDTPSSITASTNNQGGGDIHLNISERITINNNSEIDADTRGNTHGGNINLQGNNLRLSNQGRISVDSTGLGNAGNIEIGVNNFNAEQGSVTATAQDSGGGDIKLVTDFMLLSNSKLSTSVADGTGGGGNLEIDSNFVIAKDNSNIIAKANGGAGGNINITTEVFLRSLDSLVDASSQSGVDGAVDINSPNLDRQLGVVQLSSKVTDSTALIAAVCPKDDVNTLSSIGKGGLAENPSQNLRGKSVWEDLRNFVDVAPDLSASSNPNKVIEVIEARTWNVNDRGKVELVSQIPQPNKQDYWALFNQCRE